MRLLSAVLLATIFAGLLAGCDTEPPENVYCTANGCSDWAKVRSQDVPE